MFKVGDKLFDGKGNELNEDGSIKQAAAPSAEATVTLPADAKERLVAVKGVGDKLADEIIAALTGPAPVPAEQE